MIEFRNRSPLFYTLITIMFFTTVILILGKRYAVISAGLMGTSGLLTGTFFMSSEMKCERLMFRFLALQSACIGFYLWAVGMELADVGEWIVGFVWVVLLLLPTGLLLGRWLVKKYKIDQIKW